MTIKHKIYLDYQASTPTDPAVIEAMLPYLREEFGNPHSTDHAYGWTAADAVDRAAEQVAQMLGVGLDEVVFTSGATESNNLALLGLAHKAKTGPRRRIFVGATEHKCVLAAARAIHRQLDFEVHTIPVDQEGVIDLNWLFNRLDDKTLLVSVMAVNNEIGTIAPLDEVSGLCKAVGTWLHTDAAQAPYAIDLSEISEHADLISLSGHKMYGPKGIGALYIARHLHEHIEPIIHGGGQQRGLRSGTVAVHLAVGFGEACRLHNCDWPSEQRSTLAGLRNHLWDRIKAVLSEVELNGPSFEDRHPGNLNVQFPGYDAHDLLMRFQPHVAASTGAACSSGIEEPSHVLRAIGLTDREASSSIRFSVGRSTTRSEVDEAVELIVRAAKQAATA